MGTYTPNFRLYKPAPDEVVDVVGQVDNNYDTIDSIARRLMEYTYFTDVSIPASVGNTNYRGERWYKPYSNAIYAASAPGVFFQDTNAHVDTWIDATSLISTSSGTWAAYPGFEPAYRIISSSGTTTEIEWVGRLWLGGGAITSLNNYAPVMVLPAAIRPVVNKYFELWAGNTTTDYALARGLFLANGNVEFMKFGAGVATGSGENYIDLGNTRYNLEVAA